MGSYAKCVVPYCGHVQRKRKECVYARFPNDIERCRSWLRVVGVEDLVHLPLQKLTTIRYVCGCHFTNDQFSNATRKRLKGSAVPSLVDPRVVALSDNVLRNFPPQCDGARTREFPAVTDDGDIDRVAEKSRSIPAILPESSDVSVRDDADEMEDDGAGDFERTEGIILNDERVEASSVDERTEPNEKSAGWSDICRLCAKTNDHIIPIFEAEGAQHDLSDKIHKYLPVRVAETDSLPIQLCYHCAATILAWHELLEGCLDAQKQLAEMLSEQTSREQRRSKGEDWSEEAEDPEAAPADKEASSASQPDEDAKRRSDRAEETFRLFLDKQNACRGSRRIKNEIDAFDRRDETREDTGEENVGTRADSTEPGNEARELLDEEAEMSKDSRRESSWETDEALGRSKCTTCREESNDPNELRDERENTLSGEKSYKCEECSKIFRLKDSLTRHQRIHRNERPFTCHVCGKQFRDSGGLSRHLKDVHAKLKKFTCDICANSFSSKATRDDHRRTHTGERPYNCENCEKTFKSRACLYIHSKLHTDEFPYPCVHCEKKFRRRQEMLLHLTTHTGERNYSCDVCSRRFRVKTEVARHKLTHSDDKPYVCAECGLSFRQKRYLNNHVKSRHRPTSND